MIEVKVSDDRDPDWRARTPWWAALARSPEEKEGVEDPIEMERLADATAEDVADTVHRVDDPEEIAAGIDVTPTWGSTR